MQPPRPRKRRLSGLRRSTFPYRLLCTATGPPRFRDIGRGHPRPLTCGGHSGRCLMSRPESRTACPYRADRRQAIATRYRPMPLPLILPGKTPPPRQPIPGRLLRRPHRADPATRPGRQARDRPAGRQDRRAAPRPRSWALPRVLPRRRIRSHRVTACCRQTAFRRPQVLIRIRFARRLRYPFHRRHRRTRARPAPASPPSRPFPHPAK